MRVMDFRILQQYTEKICILGFYKGLECKMGLLLNLIVVCSIFLHFSLGSSYPFEKTSNNFIVDVSKILKSSFGNDKMSKTDTTSLEEYFRSISKIGVRLSINYDTEMSLDLVKELENVFRKLKEFKSKHPEIWFEIWLTIRDDDFNLTNRNISQRIQVYYKDAMKVIVDNKSLVAGVSFYGLAVDNKCYQIGSKFMTDISNVSIISEIKKLLKRNFNDADVLKLGFVLDQKLLTCENYIYNKRDADFKIVSTNLKRNDKLFVESYSLFKEMFNKEIMSKFIKKLPSSTFFLKINFDTKMYRRLSGYYATKDKKSHKYLLEQSWLSSSLESLSSREDITGQIYAELLLTYLDKWTRETDIPAKIIVNYPITKYSGLRETTGNFQTVPDLTHALNAIIRSESHIYDQKAKKSTIDMFLREVAASGFTTYRILGQTWRNLSKLSDNYFTKCENTSNCRPSNVIYFNDEAYPDKQNQPQQIAGMNVEMFAISYFIEVHPSEKKFILLDLQHSFKLDTSQFISACQIFGKRDKNRRCDDSNECKAIDVVLSFKNMCQSFPNQSSHILVIEVIKFEDLEKRGYLIEDLVDTVVKRLDHLVIARDIIRMEFPGKKIYIELSPHYIGNRSSLNRPSLYCNTKAERLGQFFEAILTWAEIHDFPVIVEPWYKKYHLEIPISWEQLESNSSRLMYDMMKNTPVFIRRSYNQSVVFGSWTKGMYPCLTQTTQEIINLSRISFDESVTVNLNLDLRSNVSETVEELQILFLISLRTFPSVNIQISHENQLEKLYRVLMDSKFDEILKTNNISRKTVYINIPKSSSKNFIEILNRITIKLKDIRFQICIHAHSAKCFKNILSDTCVGLVLNSCEKTLQQFLSDDYTNQENIQEIINDITKVSYIVCETDVVPANTRSLKTMEDFFNTHLYLKKLYQYYFPNVKSVQFHLQPTMIAINEPDKTVDLLMFLSDVANYAKGYDINYFIVSAFAPEQNTHRISSFWKIRNYTNLTDLSVYTEYQAESRNETTWVPIIDLKNEHDNNHLFLTSQTVNMLLGVVSFGIIILLAISVWILRKNKRRLSVKDIKRFRNGQHETIKRAVLERQNKNFTVNIFDGLVFQNDFEIDKKELTLNRKIILGRAKFSTIFPGCITAIQERVAVNVTNKNCSKKTIIFMLSEIKLLCYLGDHVNILKFIGCYTKEIEKGVVWVVTELCECGSLHAFLKSTNLIERKDLIRFSYEIACGLEYISNQEVIHGNLCTEKVLLDGSFTCKLFGHGKLSSRIEQVEKCLKSEKEPQNWQWLAIETLRNNEFSMETDVWSFGVTVWEIFSSAKTPYEEKTWNSNFVGALETGYRLPKPQSATDEIYNILLKCWSINPKDRPDLSNLVDFFDKL